MVAKLLDLFQRVSTAFFLCDYNIDIDLSVAFNRFLDCVAGIRDSVDQFAKHNVAHGETECGQRHRAVTELSDQIVVPPATRDGAEFSGAIEHLEDDPRVVGEPADDSYIDLDEVRKAASA